MGGEDLGTLWVSLLVFLLPTAFKASESVLFHSLGSPSLHGGIPQRSRQPGLGSAPQPGWAHEKVRKPEVQWLCFAMFLSPC